jgi:hypothetical protein
MHDGASFEDSRTKQALDDLPQKLVPLWQELLERLPVIPGPNGWNGLIDNTSACLDSVASTAEVALVDDTKAEVDFGLPEADFSVRLAAYNNIEICRWWAVQHALAFNAAGALSAQHILAKQSYADIWKSRFSALARAPIKQIVVVDRYAASQHYECPQGILSGFERFVRLLDGDATGNRYITLFSAWADELNKRRVKIEDIGSEMHLVLSRLAHNRVKRIKVVMLPNTVFGDIHHDRFIRFGEYVWDIGVGIKVFEGPCAAETSSASFKTCLLATTYKTVETTLEHHRSAKVI